ncbi:MAG: hypothetical protein M1829_003850 [Trizodia sp. TS-e1964]|nr:MAG: hypothetical protein M1829_003850 [Trizodia sp. TS-e1964]
MSDTLQNLGIIPRDALNVVDLCEDPRLRRSQRLSMRPRVSEALKSLGIDFPSDVELFENPPLRRSRRLIKRSQICETDSSDEAEFEGDEVKTSDAQKSGPASESTEIFDAVGQQPDQHLQQDPGARPAQTPNPPSNDINPETRPAQTPKAPSNDAQYLETQAREATPEAPEPTDEELEAKIARIQGREEEKLRELEVLLKSLKTELAAEYTPTKSEPSISAAEPESDSTSAGKRKFREDSPGVKIEGSGRERRTKPLCNPGPVDLTDD